MRKQTRPDLPSNFLPLIQRWQAQWLERVKINPKAEFHWYEHEGESARDYFLEFLREMNQWHCSFCDFYPVLAASNEPIEHFMPKSKFSERAYDWENLYYCCDCCNTSKHDKWSSLLLRPDDADYHFFKYFTFEINGEIAPNQLLASDDDKNRALITIETYALNGHSRPRFRIEQYDVHSLKYNDVLAPYRDFMEFKKKLLP